MDPNEIIGTPREYEVWLSPDWNTADESTKSPGATRVSVRETRYKDGRVVREVLDEKRQPIKTRTLDETIDKAQEKRWQDAQATTQRQTDQSERKKISVTYEGSGPNRVRVTKYETGPDLREADPETTAAGAREWRSEGTPDGQGGFDNSRPVMAEYVNGQRTGQTRAPNAKELEDWNLAGQMTRNPGGKTDAGVQAAATANAPIIATTTKEVGGKTYTIQTTTPKGGGTPTIKTFGPDGQEVPGGLPTDAPKPGVQQVVRAGKTYTIVTSLDPTTNVPTVKTYGPDGQEVPEGAPPETKPSEVETDPKTGRVYEIIRNLDGTVKERKEISTSTIIKPTDIPVLQARYGEIAQGVGQTLAELNAKVARGEMTPQERNEAFTAVHQQADTQVAEINSILENSRAAWGQEITQRGQTLTDTAGRRNYAQQLASNAATMANTAVARPGHGAEVGQGILEMAKLGALLGQAVGAFKDSPEIAMPQSVQQAQGIGLPGLGVAPSTGAGTPPAAAAAPAPGAPAAGRPAPLLPPQPPVDLPGAPPEAVSRGPQLGSWFTPGTAGAALQSAAPNGVPVAAGGQGLIDPQAISLDMIGPNPDPEWAAAVARAHQEMTGQPLFGGNG